MEVTLDPQVPLFAHLARLSREFESRGRTLRLVGGMAMLIWRKQMSLPLGMTRDLDCVLLKEDARDESSARALSGVIHEVLGTLGFRRPENWRERPAGLFGYLNSSDPTVIEFLCGNMPVGRESRRKPAWLLVEQSESDEKFYAAQVPFLDLVPEWVRVEVQCGAISSGILIPSIVGLAALKLKAVGDKLDRLAEEKKEQRVEHEKDRLQRHANDCQQLIEWNEERGEFDQLIALLNANPAIRDQATKIALWMLHHPVEMNELGLAPLEGPIRRLT